jgi:hypothetical protein
MKQQWKYRVNRLRIIRHSSRQILVGLAALLVLLVSAAPAAQAADSGGNGLRVSPVRSDLTIKPGETYTLPINVTNVTAVPADLQAIVNDFTASSDESGNPAIILDPTKFASGHSLKRFVLPISNFSLAAGETKPISVNIAVPKTAAGGGYFGAIRFAPASSTIGPKQNVKLAGSVGSLILVKVPGDIKEQVAIASFDARTNDSASSFFTSNKGINAVVRFRNLGNIQEAPFGKIQLQNRAGKVLATYEINNTTPASNVLPDSIRKFSIPLKKVGSFGEFKLVGNFGYGSGGQLLSASTTFYVIPVWLILIGLLVVLFVLFLIFGLPRLIRSYNRWVLRKAGRKA